MTLTLDPREPEVFLLSEFPDKSWAELGDLVYQRSGLGLLEGAYVESQYGSIRLLHFGKGMVGSGPHS